MPPSVDILLSRVISTLSIAHHIPGRIRLKLTGTLDVSVTTLANDVQGFAQAARQTPGIRSISVNPLARSCTVEYDVTQIPPAAWVDLLSGNHAPAADQLRHALLAAAQT